MNKVQLQEKLIALGGEPGEMTVAQLKNAIIELTPDSPGEGYASSECNGDGVPFCKLAPTWLMKGKEKKIFSTQAEVDEAWENGWKDK